MNEPEKQEPEFKIPIADVAKAVRKRKIKIAFGAAAFAALMGGYALLKPVQYESEGTFKEKSNSHSSMNTSSLATMFLSGFNTGGKSEVKTMMSSRKLLQQLVKTLNLQASLREVNSELPLLKKVRENLAVEYNYLRDLKEYPLNEPTPEILVKNVEFPGEFPLSLQITVDPDHSYQLFDSENKKIGEGKIGTPFTTREYSFTLARKDEAPLSKKSYTLTLNPLYDVVSELSKKIQINPDKDDGSLLILTYRNRDRQLACETINQLMFIYQNHLRTEQHRIATEQINYLNRREKEMGEDLKAMIEEYAEKLSQEVSSLGYANSEKAMDFLTSQLHQFRGKNLLLDLELKRLTGVLDEESEIQMDAYFRADSNPKFINKIIEEISELKQKSDSLELALRNTSREDQKKWEDSFQEQVAEIEEIRQCSSEACLILAHLEKERFPLPLSKLKDNPKYNIKTWLDQFQEIEQQWKQAPSPEEKKNKREEWKFFKEQFTAYLSNLAHYLEVREKAVQERLSRQQAPQEDFKGFTLETGKELYISYLNQLSDVEGDIVQYNFLIEELKDPNFEISSLSSLITDPVTRELANTASSLVLALQDDINRSVKEKERMKKELDIKRRFLAIHLNQTVELLNLKKDLIKDKIQSLQNSTLELVQQQISILEKQLSDSIETHIRNIKDERKLIAEHQLDLRREMATLPQKWATEMMIEQQLKVNAKMVEEITKLVESKNIATNLEMVQSAPVDLATSSVRPLRPNILLYTLLGAVLGALTTSGFIVVRNIARGFPASREGIELSGLHVSGELSKRRKSNVQTMKRLAAFLTPTENDAKGSSLFLANGKGFDCSDELIETLHKKELKVLKIDFTDKKHTKATSSEKPMQASGKDLEDVPIQKGNNHDVLCFGGLGTEALESLSPKKLREFLSKVKGQYDWTIVVADAPLDSVEVEAVMPLFDYAAINVSGEPLNELYALIKTIKNKDKENFATFLITEDR